ncbi:MAG: cobaltochelatase subunit CobT [Micavibrio sp.]|nr:cobaltochelatase subunit CobT [Micavibrio sp.]
MSENIIDTESLKQITSAAMRTLAADVEMDAIYSSAEAPVGRLSPTGRPRIPAPNMKMDERALRLFRGCADIQALYARHHDEKMHRRLAPSDFSAREVFDALEQARCEAIGARKMRGVAANMNAVLEEKCKRAGFESMADAGQIGMHDALHVMARLALTGEPIPPSAQNLVKLYEPILKQHFGEMDLSSLADVLNDQQAFAARSKTLLQALGVIEADQADSDDLDSDSGAEDENNETPPEEEGENPSEEQEEADQSGMDESITEAEDDFDEMDGSYDEGQDDDLGGEGQADQAAGPSKQHHDAADSGPHGMYEVYTTAFDEEVGAQELAESFELERLRKMLDEQLSAHANVITKLANRLQRKLMAQQQRSWRFDLEEGVIHAPRLARIIANPTVPLTFKQEREQEFRDTVVTLLIDNSGSMRGRPIALAAMSADIIARTLERCGVKVEVLGFTTRAWKGGKSRELWQEQGRPPMPGRLNDLRHIIYKAADAPMRRTRKNIGLMLKEGILKENIDGEALVWAYNRLAKRPEARKILMVISDGAPVDDSTLSVNPTNLLEADLRSVIKWIEDKSKVELTAIGIGHDVTRYYERALTISDADALAGALVGQLADLFEDA